MRFETARRGNTIAEYSIMIGLVALASVGALSMFGGSVSKLLGLSSQGEAKTAMQKMSSMEFAAAGQAPIGGSNPSGGGGAKALPNGVASKMALGLMSTSSSGGVNATSVDGSNSKVQTVQKSLTVAQRLQQVADSLPEGALKLWYENAANNSLLLAGHEASLSYKLDNNQSLKSLADANLGPGDALYGIQNYYSQLGVSLISIPAEATPAQRQEAMALINGELGSLKTSYADTLSKYMTVTDNAGRTSMQLNTTNLLSDNLPIGVSNYTKSAANIKELAPAILSSGAADGTPEVKSSLTTGLVMDTRSTGN